MSLFRKIDESDSFDPISMTPLIDVVLVLLIAFMIAAPTLYQNISLVLPQGNSNNHVPEAICFAIDKQGNIYSEQQKKITINDCFVLIARKKKGTDLPIIIFADRDVACGKVIQMIDALQTKGYRTIYCKTKSIQ